MYRISILFPKPAVAETTIFPLPEEILISSS
jgi:hypothetical protein